MPSAPFESFTSAYVALPAENIDTDQIIPARFLTTTTRTGLGLHAFHDWRYTADGAPNPDFVLNRPASAGARILVAGRNFGCGSSREHAVWALAGAGFDVVISEQFADIFRGNALGNSLLPVQVSADVVARLLARAATGAPGTIRVDLEAQHIITPDGDAVSFPIAPFARHRLLHGIDEMDFLLESVRDIGAFESRLESSRSTERAPAVT
jgi:3-isopropylmalate/(R)-2-methylmalate dehydratase small subunit